MYIFGFRRFIVRRNSFIRENRTHIFYHVPTDIGMNSPFKCHIFLQSRLAESSHQQAVGRLYSYVLLTCAYVGVYLLSDQGHLLICKGNEKKARNSKNFYLPYDLNSLVWMTQHTKCLDHGSFSLPWETTFVHLASYFCCGVTPFYWSPCFFLFLFFILKVIAFSIVFYYPFALLAFQS